MQDMVPSIAMLAAIALVLGAIALWRRGGYQKQAFLMVVMAVVLIGNVVIWVMPTRG